MSPFTPVETPVAAKSLAARHGLPPGGWRRCCRPSVHAGVLKGVRGARGGYELARERPPGSPWRRSSAWWRAPRGEGKSSSRRLVTEVVQPAVAAAVQTFDTALDTVTLEDLCRAADQKGHGIENDRIDFII